MAKFNLRSKRTWKKILSIGLGILLTVGAVVGISALTRKSEETRKEINPKYAIGGLTEQGKYLETEESIYTKDAFECQGLDIELDFRSNVSYRVFFYNEDSEFVSSTSKLIANYDEETTPVVAKFARIVITPNDDTEIKWYEKAGYANQLTISVSKEQGDLNLPFKGVNRFKYLQNYSMENTSSGVNGYSVSKADVGYNMTELVRTTNCTKLCIKADIDLLNEIRLVQLSQNAELKSTKITLYTYEEIYFNGETYLEFELLQGCEGVVLFADATIDFSNFELYVW